MTSWAGLLKSRAQSSIRVTSGSPTGVAGARTPACSPPATPPPHPTPLSQEQSWIRNRSWEFRVALLTVPPAPNVNFLKWHLNPRRCSKKRHQGKLIFRGSGLTPLFQKDSEQFKKLKQSFGGEMRRDDMESRGSCVLHCHSKKLDYRQGCPLSLFFASLILL